MIWVDAWIGAVAMILIIIHIELRAVIEVYAVLISNTLYCSFSVSMTHSDSFDQLMNAFWLRPETAMWREIDIRAMRSFKFSSPSFDLGCGDGLFSFIRAGGCFDWSFDAFPDIGSLD